MVTMGCFNQVPLKQELFLRDEFRWSYAEQKHIETYDMYTRNDWVEIIVGKQDFREQGIDYFGDSQDINDDFFLFYTAGNQTTIDILCIFAELTLLRDKCEKLEFYELAANIHYIHNLIGNTIKFSKEQDERFDEWSQTDEYKQSDLPF